MELLADRDPEDARKLLDPVFEHLMEAVHRFEGAVNQVMGDGCASSLVRPTNLVKLGARLHVKPRGVRLEARADRIGGAAVPPRTARPPAADSLGARP
jgi:class 3 adenylate cyclase